MSKPAGRNNGKIITRNQGGGNKLQGLAPGCTAFYIAKSTGQSYYTETGDGRNRNLVLCVNQLGGVGRGRSQFRANADGKRGAGCDDIDDIFTLIHSYTGTPLSIDFYGNYFILHNNIFSFEENISISNVTTYDAITKTDNNINLLEPYLSDICHNLNNIINLTRDSTGIDLPILSDKIYMLDINNTYTYTGDASYVNVYNSRTFTKYDNSYSIYKPNIINSTDFVYGTFAANALNLYYTNSTTKLGYWYIDASINIKYNTSIETIDISNINITTDHDISLNNFNVCAFNNNFAFTDTSENLIIYFDRNFVTKNKSIIAIPITSMTGNNYGSFSNTNFITSGSHEGTLVMMILDKQIENALIIKRYNRTNNGSTSLTIPIRNSLYNLLISIYISGEGVALSIEIMQLRIYNISPNGEYLGLFNYHTRFLEIYKFDGIKYNLHRRKTDINFSNSSTVIFINSITNDGTIVSITISNPIDKTALTKIYRLN